MLEKNIFVMAMRTVTVVQTNHHFFVQVSTLYINIEQQLFKCIFFDIGQFIYHTDPKKI